MQEKTATPPEPQGVMAIFTDHEGRVIATTADFSRSGLGGFKLWEAQRARARDDLTYTVIKAYCPDIVANSLTSYTAKQIVGELQTKGKCQITYQAIGWPDHVAASLKGL